MFNLSHKKSPYSAIHHNFTTFHTTCQEIINFSYDKSRLFQSAFPCFIYNRCKFCSSPNISCSLCPLRNTYLPCNPERFLLHNRGILLRLSTISPARQSVFRIPYIYIAKMASFFSPVRIYFGITPVGVGIAQAKLAFERLLFVSSALSRTR